MKDPERIQAQYAGRRRGLERGSTPTPPRYLSHRAELVVSLGPAARARRPRARPRLRRRRRSPRSCPGSTTWASTRARRWSQQARRHGVAAELGDLNEFAPAAPVAATCVFRAIYYARDRAAFFRHVAGYTERKLVFDLNPRQYRLEDVRADLRAAGFARLELRPFFVPQTVALPRPAVAALRARRAERPGGAPRAPVPLHVPLRGSSARAGRVVETISQFFTTSNEST